MGAKLLKLVWNKRSFHLEVNILDVLILLAWRYLVDLIVEAVKSRVILIDPVGELVSILAISRESPQNQILIDVIKLIPVFILVIVWKELSLGRVTEKYLAVLSHRFLFLLVSLIIDQGVLVRFCRLFGVNTGPSALFLACGLVAHINGRST